MISFLLEKKSFFLSIFIHINDFKLHSIVIFFFTFSFNTFFPILICDNLQVLKKKKVFTYEDSFKDPLFSLNKLHVLEHNRQAIFW